ncbi:hypothetical protein KJ785_04370 [Patescibacteria group bacterium]|nr:hypothetical protein [Patescibacteria group bacterium]
MFWHKQKNKDFSLLIFGLISFLIIVFIALIIIILLAKVKENPKEFLETKEQIKNYIEETPTVFLKKNYYNEMKDLVILINGSSVEDAISVVEKSFFSTRVPQENLDVHLQTFLKIKELEESGKLTTDEIIKLLNDLMTKIDYEENYN